ncbi:MAG: N(G),N(G)-dimethylarginine dimethylaminohydrolase [Gammaproteobacteria bacterium CG22_combo_CG10-13_8_21_14_all_40_8]|nr:MAG: N(G),N(G)-dimethylarginine dimethylaminohydrolase [Gammaproteobacteria bacterium CG22_combo_CG10-13_8_21_14_all_40_8]
MFSKAIVRTPCKNLVNGLTAANLGLPDYEKALLQHQDYIRALEECGLKVTVLAADDDYPDSTFVEDVALLTQNFAILTNPGAPSRKGEVASMLPVLKDHYQIIESIAQKGTVEAGDVMMVGKHFYIGLSERTNLLGARQMIHLLETHQMTGSVIALTDVLHLKTGVMYLENNNLLVSGEFVNKPEFKCFNRLEVDADEAYAANSVWINGTVLTPKGFPKTKKLIESAGYSVREVDVSEFQKIDGGLSCLSLRF